jgi:hypothetical protein
LHGAPRYRREGIETDAKIMGWKSVDLIYLGCDMDHCRIPAKTGKILQVP